MAETKIKLPRSSYEELCKIIKAYGRLDKPGSLDQVNALAGVGKTTVSANNSFLTSIGLIKGGKAKAATAPGKKLAHALEHDISQDIEAGWRAVVEGNEFLRKMALALKIRKTMEESTFVSHIAYSAGETKSTFAKTGARAVIDVLRCSGFIREEDGRLSSREIPDRSDTDTDSVVVSQTRHGESTTTKAPQPATAPVSGNVAINIDIRIDAKPDDIPALGRSLKAMLKDLESQDDDGSRNA